MLGWFRCEEMKGNRGDEGKQGKRGENEGNRGNVEENTGMD